MIQGRKQRWQKLWSRTFSMTQVHVVVYAHIQGHWSPSIWITGLKILPRTISITHEMGFLFTTCQYGMSVHQPGDGKQTLHQLASHVIFAVLEFCHCRVRLWCNSSNPGTKVYLAHTFQKGVCSQGLKSRAQGQTVQLTRSITSYWTNPLHDPTFLRKVLTKLWVYCNGVTKPDAAEVIFDSQSFYVEWPLLI